MSVVAAFERSSSDIASGSSVGGDQNLRRLVADFAARAAAHDRDGSFPFENFERLRAGGLLALTVPREQGGTDAGLAAAASVIGAIAEGDPSTALVLAMHYLQHAAIARSPAWPERLRVRLARDAVETVALVNALRVEPALGTPARGGLPATAAERLPNGGGWRLNGRKTFCTGAPALRWLNIWARTEDEPSEVGMWLVPADAPGVRIVETWDHLGMRASGSHDVVLEDVVVPPDHAVDVRPPREWAAGPDPVQAAWNVALISAIYDGIARSARDWVVRHVKERTPTNLGAPLSTLPRVQESVGEIEALLAVNRRLLSGLAADVQAGSPPPPPESGLIKLTVTGNAIRAVEAGLALVGNAGLSRKNPLERHYRDVLCGRVHTPQDDSTRIAAGRAALER